MVLNRCEAPGFCALLRASRRIAAESIADCKRRCSGLAARMFEELQADEVDEVVYWSRDYINGLISSGTDQ